ncbi:MAG TPA: tetratricopeptide repeat protein [Gemmatimonadales bacterium]
MRILLAVTLLLTPLPLAGQARDSLDPTVWGVIYDIPATRTVDVREGVRFGTSSGRELLLDVYRPAGMRPGERRPAVVFLNAVGDGPDAAERVRQWGIYRTWPRLVAAHGLVGIAMDADRDSVMASLRAVFRFLAERGAEHGVDAERLGVYAASANASGASQLLLGDSAPAGVKAAVLYYGGVPDGELRADLPVLFVVAESDAPRMGDALGALWERVVAARAPWTLTFASRMPHAFDAFSDNDEARRHIQQTIGFWKSHLEPVPQPRRAPSDARAIVASLYGNDAERSAVLLARWIEAHPGDAEAARQQARVLVQLQRYAAADSAYARAYRLDSTHPGLLSGLGQMRIGQGRWAEAADLLQRAIGGGVDHSLIYGQLGWAQLHLGRNADAVRSYERAFERGIPPGRNTRGIAWYNLACAYARIGDRDRAIAALEQAFAEGVNERRTYEQDEDLASLRADARFSALLGRMEG